MSLRLPTAFLALASALCASACQQANTAPAATAAATPPVSTANDDALVAHGEHIVRLAGCNDCHTAGYAERDGNVPTSEWLTGSPLGYNGPWGTTYASNLRLTVAGLDETQWLAYTANLHTRPIMPDFLLRGMSEHDRRAIHRFVRSLGAAGVAAPKALAPGQAPPPPYFQLVVPAAGASPPERHATAHQGQKPVQ